MECRTVSDLALPVEVHGKEMPTTMNAPLIVAILVGLLALALLVVVFVVKRNRGETLTTDFRALFVMGIIWLPIGIATGNPGLWVMGLVFLIVGLANRNKWKEQRAWSDLSQVERRAKLVLLIGLAVLLAVGVAFFLLRGSAS
jgi:hypothetical protein